ncbi:unnamed protein product [Larinioides sclopetarius]|uniref:RBR-type E3 ubiquitin transferase n=1 Tax=Larinioides sclopetarius TaxID=280406 RepID=A0AAV2BGV0_9ARAC
MESVDIIEREKDEKDINIKLLTSETSANYIKSWPVQLPVPNNSLYVKNNRPVRRRSYRFKYSCLKNWLIPLDGPMSMDHVHFLLDCFVVSAGPVPPQLGRYHPQSDPEEFVQQEPSDDTWSVNSEEGDSFWAKVGVQHNKNASTSSYAGPSIITPSPEEDPDDYAFENYFQTTTVRTEPRRTYNSSDFASPDDMIVRELSEMRLVLDRLLDNHEILDWEHPHGLQDVLDLLPDDVTPQEPSPHYPVGDWEFEECGICLDSQWLYRRACCRFPACSNCLQSYYSSKVEDGQVKIECCNNACNAYVHRDEISARLKIPDKEKFHKLLVLANQDANTKTCPRCSHLTKLLKKPKQEKDHKFPSVTCPSCHLEWCFNCHAPWHGSLSCKQFRKGDRLLRTWARGRTHGQLNAQKCPKCKIYIERTTGCDHMRCTRCKTDFCYKCGERFRYLKFFGDHYSKLSIFGCKYRFKADQPVQRKVIRGAIFGGKLIAAPVLGALALCAGALAVGISVFALPVYGGIRLYRHYEGRQTKIIRRHTPTFPVPNISLHLSHSFV